MGLTPQPGQGAKKWVVVMFFLSGLVGVGKGIYNISNGDAQNGWMDLIISGSAVAYFGWELATGRYRS